MHQVGCHLWSSCASPAPRAREVVSSAPRPAVPATRPPGKTLAARAVANRSDAAFIRVIGSELVQRYVGEGARLVRRPDLQRPTCSAGAPRRRPAGLGSRRSPTSAACQQAWSAGALYANRASQPAVGEEGVASKLPDWLSLTAAQRLGRPAPPTQVREIFKLARSKKAAIIFFDEIDAIGGTRTDEEGGESCLRAHAWRGQGGGTGAQCGLQTVCR